MLDTKLRLHCTSGCAGEREAVRVDCPEAARQVDHSEHAARRGMVDRCRRAGPPLNDFVDMFGGEHLDGVVQRDRRTHCICARASSLHRAPSTKLISSAALARSRGGPSIHNSLPSSSEDHQVLGFLSDVGEQRAQRVGTRLPSGCSDQTCRTSSALITGSDGRCVAFTPAEAHRCDDSVIGARRSRGGGRR